MTLKGYHLTNIPKGTLGEISKIQEELLELQDARDQGIKVMELCELSDIYGAVKAYLVKYHPDINMSDLAAMNEATERAFKSGHRK